MAGQWTRSIEFSGLDADGGYPAARIGFVNHPPFGGEVPSVDLDRELTSYVVENLRQSVREHEGAESGWEVDELRRLKDAEIALLTALR